MADNNDLVHNLIAYVSDPISEQVVLKTIKDKAIPYAEVYQGSPEEAVDMLQKSRSPKILILDISETDLPLSVVGQIRAHSAPNMHIIAVGTKNDVGLYRDLLNCGVSDYIVKPLHSSLLEKSIEGVSGIKSGSAIKSGKIIQCVSSVGGAGSTMVAANIAWILSNQHFKRTLLMDLDFQYGTSNLMIDIKTENAYLDILESPDKIDDYFVETILRKHDNRLFHLGGLVDLVRGINIDLEAFEALINNVKRQFNYVLLDSPRDCSDVNRLCMEKADRFIILVEFSVASAQNTARMLEFLNTTQPKKKVLIVANKVGLSSRGALTKEAFENAINHKVDYTMPLDEYLAMAAANIGQPVAASESALTSALNDIVDDILGKKENAAIVQELKEKEGFTLEKFQETTKATVNKIVNLLKI